MTEEPILVDSTCLDALADDHSPWRDAAISAMRGVADRPKLNTDGVYADFLLENARRGAERRRIAAALVRRFDDSHRVEVMHVSRRLLIAGLRLYESDFQGTVFTLQQCVLLHLAQERKISDILSSERDFAYVGLNPRIRRSSGR